MWITDDNFSKPFQSFGLLFFAGDERRSLTLIGTEWLKIREQ